VSAALLRACGIGMRFGHRRVLEDVSFDLEPGRCVGVVGENGAGKSTLLRILVGLLRPTTGEVERRARLGYCPQEPLVFDGLTVEENFRWFAAAYGLRDDQWRPTAERMLERLDFARERRRLTGVLSGGTRQKLNLAVALLAEPEVLVLDEPYAGFDWDTYQRFWALADELRAAGRAILTVSHFVFERDRFDQLLVVRGGRLAVEEAVA
jgi:ABC-2 type transport system ATP-binding protein